ncbi:unnamed protein product [Miscanthus lutarioriparius]|uniref:Uncharacterized protein n=1 Tax=Miscanthus lutarioriparius TaxID=422564 RepID=A0A811S883_9POAL|nr:unnamed protein product [Miscanthus lutarioriparius]
MARPRRQRDRSATRSASNRNHVHHHRPDEALGVHVPPRHQASGVRDPKTGLGRQGQGPLPGVELAALLRSLGLRPAVEDEIHALVFISTATRRDPPRRQSLHLRHRARALYVASTTMATLHGNGFISASTTTVTRGR